MKKITLSLFTLFFASVVFGQNYSTGTLTLDATYTAKIDVDATSNVVTLTLNGPSDRYFGLGFGITARARLAGRGTGWICLARRGDCLVAAFACISARRELIGLAPERLRVTFTA